MEKSSLRRSALYMPALNERAMNKARSLDCDMILFDLEDSVAPEVKGEARAKVRRELDQGGYGNRELVLRMNGRDTPYWADDLAVLRSCQPDAILIPKVNSGADVIDAFEDIQKIASSPKIGIWLMMETPQSVINAGQIAQTAESVPDLQGYVIGTNDLVKDTGVNPGPNRELLLPWLMTIVASAKACELDVIDGVFNNLNDEDGFEREARQGRDMGITGKSLIHPRQVQAANRIFSPTNEEIAHAQKIVAAFKQDDARGKGVITVDGKMVERLHLKMAQDTLAKALKIRGEIEG